MLTLPKDIIIEIMSYLILSDVYHVSQTCKTLYNILLNNTLFWEKRLKDDLGLINHGNDVVTLYKNSGNVISIGYEIFPPMPFTAKTIAYGDQHLVMIDNHNKVWGYGANNFGQLGLLDVSAVKDYFVKLPFTAIQIACGSWHTVFIDEENNLYGCGYNSNFQLGISLENIQHPKYKNPIVNNLCDLDNLDNLEDLSHDIPFLISRKVTYVDCGRAHTMFIDDQHNLFGMGDNQFGQLGIGDDIYTHKPQKINISSASVSCGYDHTFVIDTNNYVWCFGSNNDGQLGIPFDNSFSPIKHGIQAKTISCGRYSTMILTMKGDVIAYGQLFPSNNKIAENIKQISCGVNTSMMIDDNNNVIVHGNSTIDGYDNKIKLKARYVKAGYDHIFLLP